jgi:hypothetical protein
MEEGPARARTPTTFASLVYFFSTFVTVQVGFSRFTFSSAAAWSGASTSIFMTAPLLVLMVKVKRMGEPAYPGSGSGEPAYGAEEGASPSCATPPRNLAGRVGLRVERETTTFPRATRAGRSCAYAHRRDIAMKSSNSSRANANNRANQMNANNSAYWSSRGESALLRGELHQPLAEALCRLEPCGSSLGVRRLDDLPEGVLVHRRFLRAPELRPFVPHGQPISARGR